MAIGTRAGQYVEQIAGYKAFIPNPLPPKPEIIMDREMFSVIRRSQVIIAGYKFRLNW